MRALLLAKELKLLQLEVVSVDGSMVDAIGRQAIIVPTACQA